MDKTKKKQKPITADDFVFTPEEIKSIREGLKKREEAKRKLKILKYLFSY